MSVFGGMSRASGTGSRSASAPPWPPRPKTRDDSSAGARPTGISSPTRVRIPTRPRPRTASGCTSSTSIPKRLPWSGGSSPSSSPGRGFYAIAEGLTRDGIPSPSAHDPARNRHRCGIAWNKFAVCAILVNPRYTGHQVWSKQRKDEVLIDVDDVALGHTTKLRGTSPPPGSGHRRSSTRPLSTATSSSRCRSWPADAPPTPPRHKPHRAQHPYALGLKLTYHP